jgi:hypothetical protein
VFEHVQDTPAAFWQVVHPDGRLPVGVMVLIDDQEVTTDVEVTGTARLTFTFAFPVSGRVLYL